MGRSYGSRSGRPIFRSNDAKIGPHRQLGREGHDQDDEDATERNRSTPTKQLRFFSWNGGRCPPISILLAPVAVVALRGVNRADSTDSQGIYTIGPVD
jgi:hypothetical protein